jgi:hypothetical protein
VIVGSCRHRIKQADVVPVFGAMFAERALPPRMRAFAVQVCVHNKQALQDNSIMRDAIIIYYCTQM